MSHEGGYGYVMHVIHTRYQWAYDEGAAARRATNQGQGETLAARCARFLRQRAEEQRRAKERHTRNIAQRLTAGEDVPARGFPRRWDKPTLGDTVPNYVQPYTVQELVQMGAKSRHRRRRPGRYGGAE